MENNVPFLPARGKLHFQVNRHFSAFPVALLTVLALAHLTARVAQAQQFQTLYNFTGGHDGGSPWAGVTVAGSGVLYGTNTYGGVANAGTVYSLKNRGSGWTLDPLYSFTGTYDGAQPVAGVTIGPSGALYGTTFYGGGPSGDGTVFKLQPPANFCRAVLCGWNETFLYKFQTGNIGVSPFAGNVIFDQAGNLYGTTTKGGNELGGEGTVYEITPSGSVSVLYNFCCVGGGTDGYDPYAGVIFDTAGNLYGTTYQGGTHNLGTVFELTPSGGGTWTESILYSFAGGSDGGGPTGTLTRDSSGNLYGTTNSQGINGGTVFELSYSGGWVFTTIYDFPACYPFPGVTLDAAGNLYGDCAIGGAFDRGFVFKLTNSNGTWSLTDLYDFTGGLDGYDPLGPVAFDSSGNLFGTTSSGGFPNCEFGCGTVWEITGLSDQH
jgi:uncharacterized repeat protein (TIGR03803 family)